MNKLALIIVVATLVFSCGQRTNPPEEPSAASAKDSLTIALDSLLKQGNINGFGVAIVNENATLYARGFGLSRVKEGVSYTKNTLQNIASVSKTMIGLSLLKAQEIGKLSLDDPINKHLPFNVNNPYFPEEVITIRHLATHTAAIQDGDVYSEKSYVLENADDKDIAKSLPSASEFNLPEATMDMGAFLKNFLSEDGAWFNKTSYLEKKPGELYEYTNVGATLAAYIIELATEQSYAEFTKQHILEPLAMSSTGWYVSAIDSTQRTHLYTVDGKTIPNYRLITYPDGGLITSVDEKSKYLTELIRGYSGTGKLLSKESYSQFFSEFLSADNFEDERDTDRPFDDEYNAGLFIGHTPIGYLGHMGGDPGVSSFMFFNPKTNIGKLLFVNTDLDQQGAQQFYAIWDTLGEYEVKLNEK